MIGPLVYGGVAFDIPWFRMRPGDSVFVPIIAPRWVLTRHVQKLAALSTSHFHIAKRNEIGLAGYRVWKLADPVTVQIESEKRYAQLQSQMTHTLGPQHNLLPLALRKTLLRLRRSVLEDTGGGAEKRSPP